MRRSRNRCSAGKANSEGRGPTAGDARSGLSGTVGRFAAPLRGRHSRREDGRLCRFSRCCAACRRGDRRAARMAASEECIRMQRSSSFKQHALLKQMTVEGALCCKASCVVLVEASRIASAFRGRALLERGRCGPDGGRGAHCELHERRHSGPALRFRDRRRMSFQASSSRSSPGPPRAAPGQVQPAPRDREALNGTTRRPVSVSQTYVRAAMEQSVPSAWGAAEMWRSRLQTPFKDAAASTHSCDDEGKEYDGRDDMQITSRSFSMGPPSRSAEALSRDDVAGAILPSNCRRGLSNRKYL